MSRAAGPAPAGSRSASLGAAGSLRAVLALGRPWRSTLRYGVASGILQQLLFTGGAAIAAYAVGRAVTGAGYGGLVFYLLGLVVLALLQVRTPWLEAISCQYIANRIQVEVRARIFDALARLTPGGLGGRHSGELGAAAMADVAVIQEFFAATLPTLVSATTVPVLVLAALVVLSWQLAALLAPLLALAAIVPGMLQAASRRRAQEERELVGALHADIVDAVQGLREIASFGAVAAELARLEGSAARAGKLRSQQAAGAAAQAGAAEAIAAVGSLGVLAAAAALSAHHALGVTFVPPCVVLAALAFGPVARLAAAGRSLAAVGAASERIFALVEMPPVVAEPPAPSHVQLASPPGFCFEGVSFRYRPDLPPALDGVDFAVGPGETVALAGHSGAGKSTCANLLLRFWDVDQGAVRLGGIDVRQLPQVDLHAMVGLVSQEVYLFNTTVRDNLRLGRPGASDAEIEAAARAACAWEFIEALPDGLDTTTGERGVQLSGGQRQRLAIARVFLADPPVVVLDEAVSNLDSETELLINQAMAQLRQGRATLVIAHRLSTIRAADRVVVLDHGRVAEAGTHAQLLQGGGGYARLVASRVGPAAASDETALSRSPAGEIGSNPRWPASPTTW